MPHNGSSERPSLPPDTLYWCDEKREGERKRARESARAREGGGKGCQHLALLCAAVSASCIALRCSMKKCYGRPAGGRFLYDLAVYGQ
jgi:hypothetical protein